MRYELELAKTSAEDTTKTDVSTVAFEAATDEVALRHARTLVRTHAAKHRTHVTGYLTVDMSCLAYGVRLDPVATIYGAAEGGTSVDLEARAAA